MKQPIQLTEAQFKFHKQEGDGICGLCYEWTYGKAYPDTEHSYCGACGNNFLCGMNIAKILKVVEVK